jgi:N-acetyl-beta-hexosaminidase
VAVNFWDTLYWGGFDSAGDWAQKGYDVVINPSCHACMLPIPCRLTVLLTASAK